MIRAMNPAPPSDGIYLDYHASTPVDPAVIEAMLPWWQHGTGNPHSHEHAFGWRAAEAVDRARTQIADLIGADSQDVIFTSGATDANNLAILGTMRCGESSRRTLLTTAIDHASILGPASALREEGFRCIALPVDPDGFLLRDAFLDALGEDVLLVSVGAANNEIGTLQDVPWIADRCHEVGALLHTDAAQALTAARPSFSDWGVDLASLSAHKAYGPQGIGALFIAPGTARHIRALSFGGGQQLGLKPGTLPTALCVGFGEACEILQNQGCAERQRIERLRDVLIASALTAIPGAELNGPREHRHPGNINLRLPCDDARDVIQRMQPAFAISSGSACQSGSDQASHVLEAIGLTGAQARACVRLGIGRFSTVEDVRAVVGAMASAVTASRECSCPDVALRA